MNDETLPARPQRPRKRVAEVAPTAAVGEAPGSQQASFPIVGIGASAGGLAAFEAFIAALPQGDSAGMAFVLVQHLSPDHKSLLQDIIGRHTQMAVHEVEDGMVVQPNCIYVIPPDHDMALRDGALLLSRIPETHKPRLTIDHFFSSLAEALHERAICIVLSGTGSDGTLGLREVKGAGGVVFAQSPETAEFNGMPSSAIATGMVDYVLAPQEMPAQLLAYAHHAFGTTGKPGRPPVRDGFLKKICVLLRTQTGHDFSQYKDTTLLRRVERRMALRQKSQPEAYLRYARENAHEVEALFRDLLIGVTNFFRDPDAFELLEQKVIPRLLAHKSAHDTVRVWSCGCSTGEEAYSIAILLYEYMMTTKQMLKIQVFATDIDSQAIEQARAGVYPTSIAAHVSQERLNRFFNHDALRGTYRIQKHIRDLLVFSEQDVIKDPPFSKLDLLSCRNMLIYMNSDLQRKLIPLFHYTLLPNGVLFLGTSETVGESARLFRAVDRKWKLYSRLPGEDGVAMRPAPLPDFALALAGGEERSHATKPVVAERGKERGSLRQITEKALLSHYGHAGVLVNSRGVMLHIVGRTGKFLEPADGDASMNIFAMAREGLRRELTVALQKAVAHRKLASYSGLQVKCNDSLIKVNLAVRPVDMGEGQTLYLVVLEELPNQADVAVASPDQADQVDRIGELERELRAKDEYLQTTLEEMETTNEELKSTNEEMQSINEELQSSNEELETSKEELQSVNEELSTVNAELQDKVSELSRANNDMNNLLAGTGVATVFVDHQLRISRYTPAAIQVVNFIESDIGRPLAHMASNLIGYDRMVEDCAAVLDTLVPKEAEVQAKNGIWYLMRIRPYRTMENLIEGAVITLVDISKRKQAEEALRLSEARLNAFISQAAAGVSETDLDGRFTFVNAWFCEALGYSRDELMHLRLSDITDAQDWTQVQPLFEGLARGGPDVQLDKRYVRKDGSPLRVHERVSAIRDADGQPRSLLLLSFVPASGAAAPGPVS